MKTLKKHASEDINFTILLVIFISVLAVVAVFFGDTLFSLRYIQSMAFQIPEFGFLALAMMLSNLVGGIDLSIIATANTVAILSAYVLNGTCFGVSGIPGILLALAVALTASLLFGLVNGLLISRTSAPPLIATLGTMTLYQGIGMALTGGASVGGITPEFAWIGKSVVLGLPLIFWLFLLSALILGLLLSFTDFGRKLYLYGGNPVAARFSSINNDRMTVSVFMLTALLAGIAGIISLSRVNSAKVGYGDSYLLQTMIVCVIGGIHPAGGRGKVKGVVIAILLMQVMSSTFTLMSLSPYTKKLIWGVMLVLVLGLNHLIGIYTQNKRLRASQQQGRSTT